MHELEMPVFAPRKENREGAAPSGRVGARATFRRWMRATRSERGAVNPVMCAKAAIKALSNSATNGGPADASHHRPGPLRMAPNESYHHTRTRRGRIAELPRRTPSTANNLGRYEPVGEAQFRTKFGLQRTEHRACRN